MVGLKITFISDTHGLHNMVTDDLPGGPMIIHAGDVANRGTIREINEFLLWFSNLPYTHKIFIAGNHDFAFEDVRHMGDEGIVIPDNVIYLQDDFVIVEGIKIYGSPWQPRFFDWAFNLNRGEQLAEKWKMIPDDTDILVTHGPPFGILDRTREGLNVGCDDLFNRVLEVKPKIHVFGHIHEGYGVNNIDGTTYVNASVLNRNYGYHNKPIEITL